MINAFDFLKLPEYQSKKFVLFGDEPSIIFKVRKSIKMKYSANFEKFELNLSDTDFEDNFKAVQVSNSLFNDVKIIEIKLDKNRLSKDIIKRINIINDIESENLIIVEIPNFTNKTFKKDLLPLLSSIPNVVSCSATSKEDLQNYLLSTLPEKFNNQSNIEFLCDLYEGNFQSLHNDVEHTILIQDELSDLQELFFDNSIKNNFKLFELISNGKTTEVIDILRSMKKNDKNSAALVLWILSRDCRAILELKKGNSNLKPMRIWDDQQIYYQKVAKNISQQGMNKIILLLDKFDKSIKGVNDHDSWVLAEDIAIALCYRG